MKGSKKQKTKKLHKERRPIRLGILQGGIAPHLLLDTGGKSF
jgi:hypothetical protein